MTCDAWTHLNSDVVQNYGRQLVADGRTFIAAILYSKKKNILHLIVEGD